MKPSACGAGPKCKKYTSGCTFCLKTELQLFVPSVVHHSNPMLRLLKNCSISPHY